MATACGSHVSFFWLIRIKFLIFYYLCDILINQREKRIVNVRTQPWTGLSYFFTHSYWTGISSLAFVFLWIPSSQNEWEEIGGQLTFLSYYFFMDYAPHKYINAVRCNPLRNKEEKGKDKKSLPFHFLLSFLMFTRPYKEKRKKRQLIGAWLIKKD